MADGRGFVWRHVAVAVAVATLLTTAGAESTRAEDDEDDGSVRCLPVDGVEGCATLVPKAQKERESSIDARGCACVYMGMTLVLSALGAFMQGDRVWRRGVRTKGERRGVTAVVRCVLCHRALSGMRSRYARPIP